MKQSQFIEIQHMLNFHTALTIPEHIHDKWNEPENNQLSKIKNIDENVEGDNKKH